MHASVRGQTSAPGSFMRGGDCVSGALGTFRGKSMSRRMSKEQISVYTTGGVFGRDSPKITIGVLHRKATIDVGPGPGQYEIPVGFKMPHKKPTFPKSKDKTVAPITASVEIPNIRNFPEIRSITFPKAPRGLFFTPNDSPGPSYDIGSTLSPRFHRIGSSRRQRNTDDIPGPGEYNAHSTSLKQRSSITINKVPRVVDWMKDTKANPGPSDYDPNYSVFKPNEPAYTLGRRSRRSARKSKVKTQDHTVLYVDTYKVEVHNERELHLMRKYMTQHPEVRNLISFIKSKVMEIKPDDPVAYLRDSGILEAVLEVPGSSH